MAKGILVKEPVQIGAKCALVLAHTAIFEDIARFRLSLESCKWASARQVCCFTGMNLISAKPIHMDLFTEEDWVRKSSFSLYRDLFPLHDGADWQNAEAKRRAIAFHPIRIRNLKTQHLHTATHTNRESAFGVFTQGVVESLRAHPFEVIDCLLASGNDHHIGQR